MDMSFYIEFCRLYMITPGFIILCSQKRRDVFYLMPARALLNTCA